MIAYMLLFLSPFWAGPPLLWCAWNFPRFIRTTPKTPGAMIAYSMQSATTQGDWKYEGGYPFTWRNNKIGSSVSWRHTGEVQAGFPLSWADKRKLRIAMSRLEKARAERDRLEALEHVVTAFEMAYGNQRAN